jgi:ribosomal protein L10
MTRKIALVKDFRNRVFSSIAKIRPSTRCAATLTVVKNTVFRIAVWKTSLPSTSA